METGGLSAVASGRLRDRLAAENWETGSRACSFLEDGEIVVRNLQDDTGHGRTIMLADCVAPSAVGLRLLPVDQLIADPGEPLGPIAAAGGPHGLDGIVVA